MEFQRTKDGHEAAAVGDSVYAILPSRRGGVMLSLGMSSRKGIGDMTRDDFFAPSFFETVEEAKADLADIEASHAEKLKLDRRSIPGGRRTPWGISDYAVAYGPGVEKHSTPGHGGFKLERAQNAKVHPALRAEGGWYEEDAMWCVVATEFPELFTARERRQAEERLRHSMPDEYEVYYGVTLQEGQSRTRDERLFEERHKDDWVVTAALRLDDATTRCWATLGGQRQRHDGPEIEERIFLVPAEEYEARSPFGFVINLAEHPEETPPAPGQGR